MKKILSNLLKKLLKNKVKIEYDMSKNYARCFNESYGVAKKRKQLLKNKNTRAHSYTYYGFIYLWITIIIHIITKCFYSYLGLTTYVSILFSIIPLLYFFICLYFLWYIIRINCSSCRKIKGYFELDKNGLTDSTFNGIKILFEWKKIKMIVIKKYSITILTDTPIYFFVNREIEEYLLKIIKRFKKDIIIVRQ